MHIVKTWCENTNEGKGYLEYNGYQPVMRVGNYWIVTTIGIKLSDVKIIF